MINGNIEQFLDTGWFSEATLYYRGFSYWCEAYLNDQNNTHFFVYRYPALNVNNEYCLRIIEDNGAFRDEDIFDMIHPDIDFIKKTFLEAKIFEGRSFWEIEYELAWLDDSGDIIRKDIPEYLEAENKNDLAKRKEITSRYKTLIC